MHGLNDRVAAAGAVRISDWLMGRPDGYILVISTAARLRACTPASSRQSPVITPEDADQPHLDGRRRSLTGWLFR